MRSATAAVMVIGLLAGQATGQDGFDPEGNPLGIHRGADNAQPVPQAAVGPGVQLFTDQASFLAATGMIGLETFESFAPTGDCTSGTVSSIDFGPFHVDGASDEGGALKILDMPCFGNHNTTPGGMKYLSGDTDVAFRNAQIDFEFHAETCAFGIFFTDIEQGINVTINGNTYLVPATPDGGEAYFGIIDTVPFVTVELRVAVGSDSHWSMDDVSWGCPECFLVVGEGFGTGHVYPGIHEFQTQLGEVQGFYGALMDALPEFPMPKPRDLWGVALGQGTSGSAVHLPMPVWMLDGEFTVQVVMWNPTVFPGQPEQYTQALWVKINPNGTVISQAIGQSTGMTVWAETAINAQGQKVIRFPFTIPGL